MTTRKCGSGKKTSTNDRPFLKKYVTGKKTADGPKRKKEIRTS